MTKKRYFRIAFLLMSGVTLFSFSAWASEKRLEVSDNVKVLEDKASTNQFSAFIDQVWKNSPLIQQAEAKLKAARAQAKADSRWRYNPELTLDSEDKEGVDRTNLIGISQKIDWNGKFRASAKTAKLELQVAIAERDNAYQKIAVDALSAMADYQAAKTASALWSERARLMQRFASHAKYAFKAGGLDQGEYDLAKSALSEALIKKSDAESLLAESQLTLESAIGFSNNDLDALPAFPRVLPEIAMNEDAVDEVILGLPAIRMLQSRQDAQRSSISRAQKNRLADPTVTLKGGKDEGADIIGISVSIPLNIINSYGAEVDVAKNRATARNESLKAAIFSAKSRLYNRKKTYESLANAWNSLEKNGDNSHNHEIEALDYKLKLGGISASDYLTQVRQFLDTRVAANDLHRKAWKAWFYWLAASGNIEKWLLLQPVAFRED